MPRMNQLRRLVKVATKWQAAWSDREEYLDGAYSEKDIDFDTMVRLNNALEEASAELETVVLALTEAGS